MRFGVVGGCDEYTGAPYFVARAAAAVWQDNREDFQTRVFCLPSAAIPLKVYDPTLDVVDLDPRLLHGCRLFSVGSGAGLSEEMKSFVRTVLQHCKEYKKPVICDADVYRHGEETLRLLFGHPCAVLTMNAHEFGLFSRAADYLLLSAGRLEAAVSAPRAEAEKVYVYADSREKAPGKDATALRRHTTAAETAVSAIALARAVDVACIVVRGPLDVAATRHHAFVVSREGCPNRCGGQGDVSVGILAGMLAQLVAACDAGHRRDRRLANTFASLFNDVDLKADGHFLLNTPFESPPDPPLGSAAPLVEFVRKLELDVADATLRSLKIPGFVAGEGNLRPDCEPILMAAAHVMASQGAPGAKPAAAPDFSKLDDLVESEERSGAPSNAGASGERFPPAHHAAARPAPAVHVPSSSGAGDSNDETPKRSSSFKEALMQNTSAATGAGVASGKAIPAGRDGGLHPSGGGGGGKAPAAPPSNFVAAPGTHVGVPPAESNLERAPPAATGASPPPASKRPAGDLESGEYYVERAASLKDTVVHALHAAYDRTADAVRALARAAEPGAEVVESSVPAPAAEGSSGAGKATGDAAEESAMSRLYHWVVGGGEPSASAAAPAAAAAAAKA